MNGRILGALLVAAVVGLTILSCSPPQQAVNGQPAAKFQQWEYKLMGWAINPKAQDYNKLGADGWEFVGRDFVNNDVFKRPKR